MILAMAIFFYGGIAQIMAGTWNGKRTTPLEQRSKNNN